MERSFSDEDLCYVSITANFTDRNWLKGVLHQGWRLFPTLSLHGYAAPEPASASKKQTQKQLEREFTIKSYSFSS